MKKQSLPYVTFALISECVLNFKTGLVNRNGSPFAQLRKLHPELELPTNKKKALKRIYEGLKETYRLPESLVKIQESL
jgi:hypothetical protein